MKSIFISSTFKDMQAERDLLNLEVFPQVRDFLLDYFETLNFVDLRWGVNTEDQDAEESAKKVLQICLDEVDATRPYMIVLLGERYGWIPDAHLIEHALQKKESPLDAKTHSVTALEIEYGFFNQEVDTNNCLFYFRSPIEGDVDPIYRAESEIHKEKLAQMKARIVASGANVRYYDAKWDEENKKITGLETLGHYVEEDLKAILQRDLELKPVLRQEERYLKHFDMHYNELSRHLNEDIALEALVQAAAEKCGFILVTGGISTGKSFAVAAIKAHYENVYCVEIGDKVQYLEDALAIAVWVLEKHMDRPHQSPTGDKHRAIFYADYLSELSDTYSGAPLTICLDGIEHLVVPEFLQNFSWLPARYNPAITFVLTANDLQMAIPQLMPYAQHAQRFTISAADDTIRQKRIEKYLKAEKKEISSKVMSRLVQKSKGKSELYTLLLLSRLLMMDAVDFEAIRNQGDTMEAIDSVMCQFIDFAPDEFESLVVYSFKNACAKINPYLLNFVLPMLSQTKHGLTKSDLQALCIEAGETWLERDFSRLLRFMSFFFSVDYDGYITYRHREIAVALRKKYANGSYKQQLYAWVRKLDIKHRTYQQEALGFAVAFEDWAFVTANIDGFDQQIKDTATQMDFSAIFMGMETRLQRVFSRAPEALTKYIEALGNPAAYSDQTQMKVYMYLKFMKVLPDDALADMVLVVKNLEQCILAADNVTKSLLYRVLYYFLIALRDGHDIAENQKMASYYSNKAVEISSHFEANTPEAAQEVSGKNDYVLAEEAAKKCEAYVQSGDDAALDHIIEWGFKAYQKYMSAELEDYLPLKTSYMKKIAVLLKVADAAKKKGDTEKYSNTMKLIELERESLRDVSSDADETDQVAEMSLSLNLGHKAIEDERYEEALGLLESPYGVFKQIAMQEKLLLSAFKRAHEPIAIFRDLCVDYAIALMNNQRWQDAETVVSEHHEMGSYLLERMTSERIGGKQLLAEKHFFAKGYVTLAKEYYAFSLYDHAMALIMPAYQYLEEVYATTRSDHDCDSFLMSLIVRIKIAFEQEAYDDVLALTQLCEGKYEQQYKKHFTIFAIVTDLYVYYVPFILYGTLAELYEKKGDHANAALYSEKKKQHHNRIPKRYRNEF